MRTWFTLWLCACLLLASPVHGACCLPGGAGPDAVVVVDEAGDLPPCHRATDPLAGASGDGGGAQPASAEGCEHCDCPCRIAVLPVPKPVDGAAAPPHFAFVSSFAGFTQRSRIPPLPPPIA